MLQLHWFRPTCVLIEQRKHGPRLVNCFISCSKKKKQTSRKRKQNNLDESLKYARENLDILVGYKEPEVFSPAYKKFQVQKYNSGTGKGGAETPEILTHIRVIELVL